MAVTALVYSNVPMVPASIDESLFTSLMVPELLMAVFTVKVLLFMLSTPKGSVIWSVFAVRALELNMVYVEALESFKML